VSLVVGRPHEQELKTMFFGVNGVPTAEGDKCPQGHPKTRPNAGNFEIGHAMVNRSSVEAPQLDGMPCEEGLDMVSDCSRRLRHVANNPGIVKELPAPVWIERVTGSALVAFGIRLTMTTTRDSTFCYPKSINGLRKGEDDAKSDLRNLDVARWFHY
jgi:hypothetical protein